MKLPLPKKLSQRKRLKEWDGWLSTFQKLNLDEKGIPKFKYIPNAAWLLNNMYWRLIEQYVRPMLEDANNDEHFIHPYKIISASEIAIMLVEPIELPSQPDKERKYNALLAWNIATQIIEGWDTGSSIKIKPEHIKKAAEFKEHITKRRFYPETFAYEHIKWLIGLNASMEKPLMINAQCWRMFYFCCLSLASGGNLK